MSYLRGLIFATILTTARSSGCSAAECQDETSLVQIKANITRHSPGMQEEDASGDIRLLFKSVKHLKEAVTRGWEACKGAEDFDNGENKGSYSNNKECFEKDPHASCNDCVKSGWNKAKTPANKGAGYQCCADMVALVARLSPLCGICARYHANRGSTEYSGLKGDKNCVDTLKDKGLAGAGCDQSSYEECAQYYCHKTLQGIKATPSKALLDGMAEKCVPSNLKNSNTGMIAVVANNPKKHALAVWLHSSGFAGVAGSSPITGTASSSNMAKCVLNELTKAEVSTNSGPWGGDADLAGILSKQSQAGSPKYIKAVIFFADDEEAHRQDILALKNVINHVLADNHAYDGTEASALLKKPGM